MPGAALLVVIVAGTRGPPRLDLTAFAEPGAAVVGAVVVAVLRRVRLLGTRSGRRTVLAQIPVSLRAWAPFICAIFLYSALDGLAARGDVPTVDAHLARWDRALFGGAIPAVALERLANPWLTELSTACYALYMPLPLVVAAALALTDRHAEFRELVAAVTFTLVAGFALYLLVPAEGPRRTLAGAFRAPLTGALGYHEWATATWDRLQRVRHDAFPSLHTATATIALLGSFRYRAALARPWLLPALVTPPALGLVFSTVYLRYHWVVDVIAGALLATAAMALARLGRLGPKTCGAPLDAPSISR